MDDYALWGIALLALFIVIEGLFYGFGAALQMTNESELEKKKEEGDKRAAHLLNTIHQPFRFINFLHVAVSLCTLMGGIVVFFLWGKTWHWIIGAVVMLLFQQIFGVTIPKRLVCRNPEACARSLWGPVKAICFPLYPFVWAVRGISFLILKLFGISLKNTEESVTEEEIMSMVNEGHEQGVLQASEAEMITNIFKFTDKEASDIMTHRTNIVALNEEMTIEEAVPFILEENQSRFPVYREDMDDIVGVLHLKDVMIAHEDPAKAKMAIKDVEGLLREVNFIPETRNIDTLFKEMQSQKMHMVIVVDEYGQTTGLVTMEDILEEIVGNIMDEYDEEEDSITRQEDGTYLVNGVLPLEEVEDAVEGLQFGQEDYDDYDTLNGLLIAQLDRIPQDGEQPVVEYGGYEFHILKIENKTIQLIRIKKLSQPKTE